MSQRILVADDTPENLPAMSALPPEKGFQISGAATGRQALAVRSGEGSPKARVRFTTVGGPLESWLRQIAQGTDARGCP